MRAASVASHASGGAMQLSQLPQGSARRLAEVREQGPAPAGGQLAQTEHRIELAHFEPLALLAASEPSTIWRSVITSASP